MKERSETANRLADVVACMLVVLALLGALAAVIGWWLQVPAG